MKNKNIITTEIPTANSINSRPQSRFYTPTFMFVPARFKFTSVYMSSCQCLPHLIYLSIYQRTSCNCANEYDDDLTNGFIYTFCICRYSVQEFHVNLLTI